jgi:serine/threonine protein kinase
VTGAGPTAPGRVLGGRYHLDALIARGGMAEVWAATDQVLGRPVAVKVLHPHLAGDEALRARFHNEAIAVARLVHPAIVAIFDTCGDTRTEAIVMELVRGRTLRDFLDERGRLEPVEVVHIGAEVASALTCAHRAGIVHRDMKPANILLSDDGRVLVTDFGIAKVLDSADVTRTSAVLGTVKYLAPEQVEGAPVDARTDIYALGAVLYECVTGSPPFGGDSPAAIALARLHRSPEPPSALEPDVPPTLDAAIVRALARRPDDRFAAAEDLRAALLATRLDPSARRDGATDLTVATPLPARGSPSDTVLLSAEERSVAPPPGPVPVPVPVKARRPTATVVAGLLVTAALVVVALLVANTDLGRDLFSSAPSTTVAPSPTSSGTVPIAAVTSFDPEGSGAPGENEEQAPLVADGDPATSWRTEQYASRAFGNLKQGVGLVLTLAEAQDLGRIRIASPVDGWAVQVFVAPGPAPELAGWGAPRAAVQDVPGTAELDLDGAEGGAVLVWFTDLGTSGDNRLVVSDIELAA